MMHKLAAKEWQNPEVIGKIVAASKAAAAWKASFSTLFCGQAGSRAEALDVAGIDGCRASTRIELAT
jgi:Neuraminidase (sialidase)